MLDDDRLDVRVASEALEHGVGDGRKGSSRRVAQGFDGLGSAQFPGAGPGGVFRNVAQAAAHLGGDSR